MYNILWEDIFMQRKVNVVEDLDGNKIVFIHDVRFKGKRSIEWIDVETYLKEFVGESYVIEDTNDMIYIGADFPDEYAHSEYTTVERRFLSFSCDELFSTV